MSIPLPVLFLNGTIGSGKTTVGLAVHERLEEADMPHAFLDLDRLREAYPRRGRFNEALLHEALTAIWPVYRRNGAERLVLAGVIESADELQAFHKTFGDCSITLIRLIAEPQTRKQRIIAREPGDSRNWELNRTTELEAILDASKVPQLTISNESRSPEDTALEVLGMAGWLPDQK